jgi:hypothetical protein
VVQHADGSVTDPEEPEKRFADAQEWESAHPDLSKAVALSRNDVELVLAMPEGEARDEVLSELASTAGAMASGDVEASGDAFMPSLDDLPLNAEPEPDQVDSEAFMPSLDDLPGSNEPMAQLLAAAEDSLPLSPEELQACFGAPGELTEGRSPMDVASLVARRGTPEMQAQVAAAFHERSQTPELPDAAAWSRGAALAASASPQASYAFLHHVGEAQLADFVRSVMQS